MAGSPIGKSFEREAASARDVLVLAEREKLRERFLPTVSVNPGFKTNALLESAIAVLESASTEIADLRTQVAEERREIAAERETTRRSTRMMVELTAICAIAAVAALAIAIVALKGSP